MGRLTEREELELLELEALDSQQQSAPEPMGFADKMMGARNEIMNTAFFGQPDRLADAITGQPGQRKAQRQEFRQKEPKMAQAMSATGAVVNPPFMRYGPSAMKGAKNIIDKSLRGAGLGGAQRGLQAAGEGKDAGEVAKQTGFGALGGGLTPLVFWGIEKLWDNTVGGLLKHLEPNSQNAHATKVVMDAVVADVKAKYPHMEQEEVWKYAEQRMDEMGPRGALVDMGPNSRSLARQVYETPGQGSADMEQYLRPRYEGASDFSTAGSGDALIDDIDRIIPEDYISTKNESLRQDEAKPYYDEAFSANQEMQSNELDSILRHDEGKSAFKYAVNEMRAGGRNPVLYNKEATDQHIEGGDTGKMGIGIKMEVLNEVKIMLGKMEQDSYEADGFGGLKPGRMTKTYGDLRERLKNELIRQDATGSYKVALGLAQDKIKNRQALQAGGKALGGRDTVAERQENIGRYSEGEKKNYEIGLKRDITKKIEDSSRGGDPVKRVMKSKGMHDKTEASFQDYDKFLDWKKSLEREADISKTYAEVLGGPKTSRGIAGREATEEKLKAPLRGLKSIKLGQPWTYFSGPIQAMQDLGKSFPLLENQGIQKRMTDLLTNQMPPRPYPQGGVAQPPLPQKLAEDFRSKQLMEAVIRAQSGFRY